jgi:hypothetical protein
MKNIQKTPKTQEQLIKLIQLELKRAKIIQNKIKKIINN